MRSKTGGRRAGAARGASQRAKPARGRPAWVVAHVGRGAAGGLVAMAAAGEGANGFWDAKQGIVRGTRRGSADGERAAARAARQALAGVNWRRVALTSAAAGSVHRLKLLAKLLEGPAIYRALQRASGLKAGPLYHHIDVLRLAGLLSPKERDLYALTRAGRNVILLLAAAAGLVTDARPRPALAESKTESRNPKTERKASRARSAGKPSRGTYGREQGRATGASPPYRRVQVR